MWPQEFDQRLQAWAKLRNQTKDLETDRALALINDWWFNTPWQPYYLHWDDIETWPDPWQLLEDNIYCDVARGLGIVYTIVMLDRSDIIADLVLTEQNFNIVQVNNNKYVLNIERDRILNTEPTNSKRRLSHHKIKQKYN